MALSDVHVRICGGEKPGHGQKSISLQMLTVFTEGKLHHCFQQLYVQPEETRLRKLTAEFHHVLMCLVSHVNATCCENVSVS